MAWRRDLILARMGGSGPVETVPLAPEPVEVEEPGVIGEPVAEPEPTSEEVEADPDTNTQVEEVESEVPDPPETQEPEEVPLPPGG